jgi:hypothetical protein
MLRGLYNAFYVNDSELLDSPAVLQPARSLFLPGRMRSACVVATASSVYFTVPEKPGTVFAQYLPSPLEKENDFERYRAVLRVQDGGTWESLCECQEFTGEVVALAPLDHELFVLTLERHVSAASNVWRVHRVAVYRDRPFGDSQSIPSAHVSLPLEFSNRPEEVSFAVTASGPMAQIVHVAGPTGYFYGKFWSDKQLVIESSDATNLAAVLARETLLSSNTAGQANSNYLLLAERATGALSRIGIKGTKLQPATPVVTFPPGISPGGPSALAALAVNTSHLEPQRRRDREPQVYPEGQSNYLILLAATKARQVWSYSSLEARSCAPLLGGGSRPVGDGATQNLLDVDVGPVDTICPLRTAGFLFGARDREGWHALLLPRMLRALRRDPRDGRIDLSQRVQLPKHNKGS